MILRTSGDSPGQQPMTGTRQTSQKPRGTGGGDTQPGIAHRPSESRSRISAITSCTSSMKLTGPFR